VIRRRDLPAILTILGALALGAACVLPGSDSGLRQPRPSNLPGYGIAAHRGASATHPENTLAAFREAIRLGAHQIEMDVRATEDGQLVVIHDASVDRTTNGRGRVSQLTLEQIRPLDAGRWKSARFRGERVPTLVEALRIMPRNIWLNLHVKGEPWVAEEVALVLVEEDRVNQSILAVDEDQARLARQIHPGLWICTMDRRLTRNAYISAAIAMKADFIQFTSLRGLPTREEVARARSGGLRVNYCCESDPTRIAGLLALGIQFPMLDDVVGAMQAAKMLGIPPP
jgi:glycerophosphoryl diester phosphodiesterase